MSAEKPRAPDPGDIIWFCRRLASALQGERSLLSALEATMSDAPPGLRAPLRALRQCVRAGGRISAAMREHEWPSFVWATVQHGENRGAVDDALIRVAETLEGERALRPPRDRRLHAYSIAFGRLSAMLETHVPILTALEVAAEAAGRGEPHDVFMAARDAMRGGSTLADALERMSPVLPEMTFEMIREAECGGRLPAALRVVSDYLLDEAQQPPRGGRRQEVNTA